MDLSKISLGEALQIVDHIQKIGAIGGALNNGAKCVSTPSAPYTGKLWEIGKQYFIRTVTMYFSGRLIAVGDGFVTLTDAAWIPDTGRFADFIAGEEANEVEPYPLPVNVAIGAIIDFCEYTHTLPRKQK